MSRLKKIELKYTNLLKEYDSKEESFQETTKRTEQQRNTISIQTMLITQLNQQLSSVTKNENFINSSSCMKNNLISTKKQ